MTQNAIEQNRIGTAIANGLKRKNMTQVTLGKLTNTSAGNVSSWVSGRIYPPGDKLIKIIDILDIVSDLWPSHLSLRESEDKEAKIRNLEEELLRRENMLRRLERLEYLLLDNNTPEKPLNLKDKPKVPADI